MSVQLRMQFVPWQDISDWHCTACGYCCKLYKVVLGLSEWLRISNTFGFDTTETDLDHFYINRQSNSACIFLCHSKSDFSCGLQGMKPAACKVWPFKVVMRPKFGEAKRAVFDYSGNRLYVYVDTICNGLRYGSPTWEFQHSTVREFVEVALGIRQLQSETTGPGVRSNLWGRRLFP